MPTATKTPTTRDELAPTATKTPTTSDELADRLATITDRIADRRRDLADLEAKQVAAVVDGSDVDEQLVTARAVLAEAQRLDEAAANHLRARISDLDAAAARAQGLDDLADVRARLAAQLAANAGTAEAIPPALEKAAATIRAAVEELAELVGQLRPGALAAVALLEDEQLQAATVGVPSQAQPIPNHTEQLFQLWESGDPNARVLFGLLNRWQPQDIAVELAKIAHRKH